MEKAKKSRRKKLVIWLCVDVGVAAVVFALLLHKPARYHPVAPPAETDPNGRRVHRYLTHDLANTLYNGAQEQRPFDMIVRDQPLNEAVAQTRWLQESAGVKLSRPAIAFAPGRVVLMGAADLEGADFVITIEISPQIAEDGRMDLVVEKVKIGAVNITWPAKMMAGKMYRERIEAGDVDTDDWRTKIAASLLNDEPFEPVFPVDDKRVRLKAVEVREGEMLARFVPAR